MMRALISSASRLSRKSRLLGLSKSAGAGTGRPLVVGFLSAPSGIGSGARLIFDAFHDAGFRPAAADLTARFQPGLAVVDWRRGRVVEPDDGEGPVIVHVNAPEAPYVLSELGRGRLRNRLRIAYWAWEFEQLPRSWRRELSWFHECWAPSGFTAGAIARAVQGVPVRAVGYPMSPDVPDERRVAALRDRFGAGPGKLALYAFDMRSSLDRKNPFAAIEIFRRAASRHGDARLVLKVSSWGWSPYNDRRLKEAIGGDARIHLVSEVLSCEEMAELVASCDVYLSPHRCEGFGLVMAGALLAGKQVVMTGWSGNMDFAHLPGAYPIAYAAASARDTSGVYKRGVGRWAEPDLESAARTLQELFEGGAAVTGAEIAEAAADHFGAERWLERLGPVFCGRVDLGR